MLDSKLSRFILLPELRFKHTYQLHRAQVFECEKVKTTEICPKCATPSSVTYDHRWISVKDEPIRRSSCVLRIRKRRLFCKSCRKPFMEPVGGILRRQRTTQRLKRAMLWAAETFSSLASVEEFYRCSTSLIYANVFEQLELKLREYDYPWPKVIGIDEHFFRRENEHRRYFTIFTDIKNHRPREALLGKKKERLEAKLEHIAGRENVIWAVIDLSATYRKLIREFFPNAKIVADKFHVLRLFTKALRIVRHRSKHEKKDLPPLRMMLKSRRKLDYFQRQQLDRELKKFPEINEAYRIKEESMTFYRIKGHRRAGQAFTKLIDRLELSQLQAMKRLAGTLKKWREEILNYFVTGLTNAMSEGFNRVASLVKNRGFGYRNPKNYRLRFLSACM
jgi:transposase